MIEATKEPLTDFSINANGTLNLLELTRIFTPKAKFIFLSTNKVYGDTQIQLILERVNLDIILERKNYLEMEYQKICL